MVWKGKSNLLVKLNLINKETVCVVSTVKIVKIVRMFRMLRKRSKSVLEKS